MITIKTVLFAENIPHLLLKECSNTIIIHLHMIETEAIKVKIYLSVTSLFMMTLYLNIEHQCQKCQQQDQVSLQQVFKETLFIVAVYKNYSLEAVLSNQSQVTAKMIPPR